nr:HAD-IIA family hydrolase [Nakamurella flava]
MNISVPPATPPTPTRPWSYLCDMDGVLVHEEHMIPGADEFIAELTERGTNYTVLTNNPIFTRRDLRARLLATGLDIPEERIFTSAMATAQFLDSQRPNGSAYVIGDVGLTTALHEAGYILTDRDPDYVVLGETRTYSFEAMTTAIRLVERGARFVVTNPDPTGPSRAGILPAAGAVAALIEKATGRKPYFVGKPNPLMMRRALRNIGAHSSSTVMIGDRMDTDVIAGLESGLSTILVMSGISNPATVEAYPFRPNRIINSIADLVGHTEDPFGTGPATAEGTGTFEPIAAD